MSLGDHSFNALTNDVRPCYVAGQVVIPIGLDFGYCQADDVSERVIYVQNTGEVRKHPSFSTAVWAKPLGLSRVRVTVPASKNSRRPTKRNGLCRVRNTPNSPAVVYYSLHP